MPSLMRNPGFRRFLARIASGYLGFTLKSIRWRFVDTESAAAAAAGPEGLLVCFWHGEAMLSPVATRVAPNKRVSAMISNSRDGNLIADAVEPLKVYAVRGSRGREGASDKGGAAAFRQAVRLVRQGEIIAIHADGPVGPLEEMNVGPAMMARTAKAPMFFIGIACHPAIRPRTWDRMFFPLPFGRGAMVIDGPHLVDGGDQASLKPLAAEWQARLIAVQRRAEAIAAGKPA